MGFIRMVLGDVSCFDDGGCVGRGGISTYLSVATMAYILMQWKRIKKGMWYVRELAHFLSPHPVSNSILLPKQGRI